MPNVNHSVSLWNIYPAVHMQLRLVLYYITRKSGQKQANLWAAPQPALSIAPGTKEPGGHLCAVIFIPEIVSKIPAYKDMLGFSIRTNLKKRLKRRGDAVMSNNKSVVPQAREALNKFKMEAANEVGVNLKQGYNGDLTSKQAGSVGGQMVKKMIESYENGMK